MSDEGRLDNAIAIVGMSGHFPGARHLGEFWARLANGEECLTQFSRKELDEAGVPQSLIDDPAYVPAAPTLDEMEWFDAGFFGMSPRDAAIMDPQHRHFLECCWEAFENAGHVPRRFDGSIGVFAGCGTNSYFWRNVMTNPELVEDVGFFLLRHTGNDKDFLSTRVSYAFDLKGPSVNVQTACSTSLVAVHYAVQSLLAGECDMALAGGSTIEQPHRVGYLHKEGEILSPDGHCRPFDADSAGTLFGSGAGAVLLRRYEDAVEDRDHIHAVILGSAINNDGAGKVGYLAPSVDGQAQAIQEALSIAEVEADSVSYVEAHGTGTLMGDPIEVAALTQAFRASTERNGFCGLGSLKSNVGHLDTAAGIAGLIKIALSMKHELLPPTANFTAPNPSVPWESSPFFVVSEPRPWLHSPETPRRAGVSSLGVGGTNAHVVLEEAPVASSAESVSGEWQLLPLSTKSRSTLERASTGLAEHLEQTQDLPLSDVAYTLAVGREEFVHRRVVVARSSDGVVDALGTRNSEYAVEGEANAERSCVFMFAGGGAQYPGMAKDLYDEEPAFAAALDECLEIGGRHTGRDLRGILYPSEADHDQAVVDLRQPSVALPILFGVQYAMARLLDSWGLQPTAMIGHSMGEYTAACLSGVLTLEGAIQVVSLRGRLFEQLDAGAMIGVSAGHEEVRLLLPEALSIAAANAPDMCVVAGPVEPLAAFEEVLEDAGKETRRIHIDVAAHSKMLDPILESFAKGLEEVEFGPASIPFVSNLSGHWVEGEASTPEYWVRHLRETVRFSDGMACLLEDPTVALVEVGPGRTLATLARANMDGGADHPIVTTLPRSEEAIEEPAFARVALAALWAEGVRVPLDQIAPLDAKRTPLPTYPFDKAKHWIEPGRPLAGVGAVLDAKDESSGCRDFEQWFSVPHWEPEPLPSTDDQMGGAAVVVAGDAFGALVKERLSELDLSCQVIHIADEDGEGDVHDVRSDEAWTAVFDRALSDHPTELTVFYLPPAAVTGTPLAALERTHFYGLAHLLRGLEGAGPHVPVRLVVGTQGLAQTGQGAVHPGSHLVLGPSRVGPREFPGLSCRVVDLDERGLREARNVVQEAIHLGAADEVDTGVVAYDGGVRHVQKFVSAPLSNEGGWSVDSNKKYLITGGLGGLGLALAETLSVAAPGISLALLGRSPIPDRDEWEEWGQNEDGRDRVEALRRIESNGSTVQVLSADLTDHEALRVALASTGGVHGVFHAAGTLDDAPLLAKSDSEWAAVLGPKVAGTTALWMTLDQHPLEFMICFSSRSAITGLPGQADYAAANAFLDGFAARWDRPDRRVISVGWDAWSQVGMAYRLFGGGPDVEGPTWNSFEHHIFDRRARLGDSTLLGATLGQDPRHWMLSEHRIKDGPPLIPGSGYVEIARAAAAVLLETEAVELSELMFLEPFVVRDGEQRDLIVVLDPPGPDGFLSLELRAGSPDDGGTLHVRGKARRRDAVEAPAIKLRKLRRGSKKATRRVGQDRSNAHLDFGPRWANLVEVGVGPGGALAELSLLPEFHADLERFSLHPALLDLATSAGLEAMPDYDRLADFYVPTSYGSVRIRKGLAATIFSHATLKEGTGNGVAILDVVIYDERGVPLVEIEDFVMMRIESFDLPDPTPDHAAEDEPTATEPDWTQYAIPTAQGMEALRRIMRSESLSRVLVTPRSVEDLLEEARDLAKGLAATRRRPPPRLDSAQVESALEGHDAVAESSVVASWVGPDEFRIVAFLVFAGGKHATVSELRRFLKGFLAADLVPHSYIEVTELPRLEDGRVDKRSLPNPFEDVDEYVPPRTDTEQAIARIWEEVLGIDRVGLHDNFLDVGGHSLVGIRTLLRIEKETGHRLHPNALTLQTLEQLAAECDREVEGQSGGGGQEAAGLTGRLIGAVRQSVGGGS